MLRHGFFIYISLLVCNGEPLLSSTPTPYSSFVSPDLRRDDTFAVAHFDDGLFKEHYRIDLNIENWRNHSSKNCSLVYETRGLIFNMGANSLTRLKNIDKIVLVWWREIYNKDPTIRGRFYTVVAMDIKTCSYSDLDLANETRSSQIVMQRYHGGFDVYIHENETNLCEKGNAGDRCVIRYDSNFTRIGQPALLGLDVSSGDWHVERVRNGNFMARGFKDSKTYSILEIDNETKAQKTLSTFIDAERVVVVSSGSAVCWRYPLVHEDVPCEQLDENGFQRRTKFDVAVTPLAVREVSHDELFVLVGGTYCSIDGSCWDLRWARVSKDKSILGKEKFECTGVWDHLIISEVWHEGEHFKYGYVCRNGDRFIYNENTI